MWESRRVPRLVSNNVAQLGSNIYAMGGHCSGSPDRATPCSTATPHTTLKRLQFPLNGSKYRTIQSQQRCDILANSVSCKRCQSSISIPFFFAFAVFVCGFSLWQCAMKSSIKSDWRKTLSLSGKLCCKVSLSCEWKICCNQISCKCCP